MSLAVQLDLVSGGRAELVLGEPDQFPSSYFVSMEHSGNAEFWQVVVKLLAAAKRPVCKFGESLRNAGLKRQDVTDSAMRNLLQTNGYAFGIFRDIDPALTDLDLAGLKTFMFVRDPRDVVVSSYVAMKNTGASVPKNRPREESEDDRDSDSIVFLDFVGSPDLDRIALQYHRFADFCRSAKNVTVFRYEDVMFTWRTVVASLIEKLDLQIPLKSAFAIADSFRALAEGADVAGAFRELLDEAVCAILEEKFAYPMAFFGYFPDKSLPSAFLDHQAEFLQASSERLSAATAQCSDLAVHIPNPPEGTATGKLKKPLRETARGQIGRIDSRPTGVATLPLIEEVCKLKISEIVSPHDPMNGHLPFYFYVGQSDLLTVLNVLSIRASYRGGDAPITDILDFGCSHGRVARWFRAAFPNTQIYATALDKSGVGFCVENFGCREIAGDIPARFDLVWLGSVFTHLPAHVAEPLLQSLPASLRPNGVLVFTSQGRYCIERMKGFDWKKDHPRWMHFNLDRARFETIVTGYHETGYGYVDYPTRKDYGVCIVKSTWYSERVLNSNEFIQILFQEKGSGSEQDVIAFMRTSLVDVSKGGRLWEQSNRRAVRGGFRANARWSHLSVLAATSSSRPEAPPVRSETETAPISVARESLSDTANPPTDWIAARPVGPVELDPALLWRLKPNASAETTVLGRRVVMGVDSIGCRAVVGQPQTGEKTLAAYGCSFTFGWAIADEETFCSQLQSMFPTWRVENHGVGGYGATQNLIQLQRDSRWGAADYVTFCWIPHHMLRNIADPSWMQLMTKRGRNDDVRSGETQNAILKQPQTMFPRAFLDQDGKLQYRSVKFPRWDLIGIDWTDFSPDPHYLDLICFGLFQRAAGIVNRNGGHFFVTTLKGRLSPQLQRMLNDRGIPVVDTSLREPEYSCLPDDPHPNALANRIYAEKIRDYLVKHGTSRPAVSLHPQAESLQAFAKRLSTVHAPCSDLAAQARVAAGGTGAGPLKKPLTQTASSRTAGFVRRPFGLMESDPVLRVRLKLNASDEITVLGRKIVIDIDPVGCRPVAHQPQAGEKTLAVYGCSFTFGTAIAAEETFCSLLQSMFPAWRVENHGVPSYCGTQNLIQLQRNRRWSVADYVTFCWADHHLRRNVADASWIQMLSKLGTELEGQTTPTPTPEVPQWTCPRASLDQDGKLQFRSVRFPRLDLAGIDLKDFGSDSYYRDLVCYSLFTSAAEIVKQDGGRFFVTTLQDHLSPPLHRGLTDFGIPVVDASVDGAEYTCLPDDPHPNALANRIYAEKIRDYLVQDGAT